MSDENLDAVDDEIDLELFERDEWDLDADLLRQQVERYGPDQSAKRFSKCESDLLFRNPTRGIWRSLTLPWGEQTRRGRRHRQTRMRQSNAGGKASSAPGLHPHQPAADPDGRPQGGRAPVRNRGGAGEAGGDQSEAGGVG